MERARALSPVTKSNDGAGDGGGGMQSESADLLLFDNCDKMNDESFLSLTRREMQFIILLPLIFHIVRTTHFLWLCGSIFLSSFTQLFSHSNHKILLYACVFCVSSSVISVLNGYCLALPLPTIYYILFEEGINNFITILLSKCLLANTCIYKMWMGQKIPKMTQWQ